MKTIKKVLAMLLTFAMVMGMTVTAFAATAVVNPSEDDVAKIAVNGLPEEVANVKAYQIVDAQYTTITGTTNTKFEKYVSVAITTNDETLTVADPEKPSVTEVTNIASAIQKKTVKETLTTATLTWDSTAEEYSANVGAGYWVVLVDPIDTEIYNPMLAGVYYVNTDRVGNAIAGTEENPINADGKWVLNSVEAHVKSTETNLDKQIVDAGSGLTDGDDVKFEDVITYKVTTKIPAYSAAYKDVTFKITDQLSDGIDFVQTKISEEVSVDAIVNVGGTDVAEADTTYTMTVEGRLLTIDFKDDFIKANGGKDVVITYKAQLNENAKRDEVANPNDVTLEFTHDPDETTDKKKDSTNHYTFDFGIVKVNDKTDAAKEFLEGAEFKLSQNGTVIRTETSAEETGIVLFEGLDEGTYTFVETKAPEGYQLDTTVHTVEITADYNEDGSLKSYTITVDGTVIESYGLKDGEGNALEPVETKPEIKNTKLISLPSTGGIGTTIFTIAGCAIMIAAAFLFIVSRRKEMK